MRYRDLAVLILVVSVASLPAAGPAAAQTVQTAAWTSPRTVDGQPDLQGVWLSNGAAPLERPSALAGRTRLTDEEVATLQARADRIFLNGRSAFAAGDAAFRAAFEDVGTYASPSSTSSSVGMVDRVFDNRTSMVVDPPDGQIPPVTPEARRRQSAVAAGWQGKTGPEDFSSIHRCITTGVPRGWAGTSAPDRTATTRSCRHPNTSRSSWKRSMTCRIIPLDGRPRLPERIRQWNGDSRGRWEGDTLVVETRNFSSNSYFRGAAEDLRLVERFARTAEDTITYSMTFTDPTTWLSSWTAQMPLHRMDEAIYEFACHEGNHSMVDMLAIARLEQRVR